MITLLGWPEELEQEHRVDDSGMPIDLSKKRAQHDIYTTEESLFRLDEFLVSLGLSLEGKTYEQVLPEAIGQPVKIEITQVQNQDGTDWINQFGRCFGTAE